MNLLSEALRSQGRYSYSLGYIRYYDFIRPNTKLRYFPAFPFGIFAVFACHFCIGSPVPLLSPDIGLALLMPCAVQPVNRLPATLKSRRVALPFDFDTVKVIFDTSSMGSLSLNSYIHTIQLIILQTILVLLP